MLVLVIRGIYSSLALIFSVRVFIGNWTMNFYDIIIVTFHVLLSRITTNYFDLSY